MEYTDSGRICGERTGLPVAREMSRARSIDSPGIDILCILLCICQFQPSRTCGLVVQSSVLTQISPLTTIL
ncbi:MAG: hypothetical protein BWY65_01871 [Firmicutes bacterium ADurb.Bin373]|nr:MAG: hypothetical protein BWY65_01871 [Firmicutes bacterium ADurb.Bin373]